MPATRGRSALAAAGTDDDASGALAVAAHHGRQNPHRAPGEIPLRELLGDHVLDALLDRSRDGLGGLRLTGEGSMLGELAKAVLERALEAELTAHLGYGKHKVDGYNSGNSRNGKIAKTVQTGVGPVSLAVPRDRAGTFEPVLVPKRAGRISGGLDDMIISLYAHGMTVRDIQHHLRQVYGTELSHEAISNITEQVMDEARAWQARPLEAVYAVVLLDAIVVKVRDNHSVQAKPAYLAVGIDTEGEKHVLGIWLAKTPLDSATAGEGARFWTSVMTDVDVGEDAQVAKVADVVHGTAFRQGFPADGAMRPRLRRTAGVVSTSGAGRAAGTGPAETPGSPGNATEERAWRGPSRARRSTTERV